MMREITVHWVWTPSSWKPNNTHQRQMVEHRGRAEIIRRTSSQYKGKLFSLFLLVTGGVWDTWMIKMRESL